MQSSHKSTPIIVGTLAVASIIGAGAYVFVSGQQYTTDTTQSKTQVTQPEADSTQNTTSEILTNSLSNPSESTASEYTDGTYTAATTYSVPRGGQNSIAVTITVQDGVISSVDATHDYSDLESGFYVDSFDADISGAVEGDNLSDAYAGRVGGASLTSSAFMDALQIIQNEAKV